MEKPQKSEGEDYPESIRLKPVGVVRNASREAGWGEKFQAMNWRERASGMRQQSRAVSELIINPDLVDILDGIDDFSHLMVLYWAHLVPERNRRVMKVHPLGSKDFPLVGTYATHSPARPNGILVTVVRLLEREGNVLKVTGLDALDGSPILDIKPWLPERQDPTDVRIPDWMRKMHDMFQEDSK